MKVHLTAMLGRRQAQTRQKLTMVWLSEVTGISTNKLYDLENGRTKLVDMRQLDALCTILNCSVSQLLEEEAMPMSELPLRLRKSWRESARENNTQDAAEALYNN